MVWVNVWHSMSDTCAPSGSSWPIFSPGFGTAARSLPLCVIPATYMSRGLPGLHMGRQPTRLAVRAAPRQSVSESPTLSRASRSQRAPPRRSPSPLAREPHGPIPHANSHLAGTGRHPALSSEFPGVPRYRWLRSEPRPRIKRWQTQHHRGRGWLFSSSVTFGFTYRCNLLQGEILKFVETAVEAPSSPSPSPSLPSHPLPQPLLPEHTQPTSHVFSYIQQRHVV